MTKTLDNSSSTSNEIFMTRLMELRWLYGIIIPSFTTIFLLFILRFSTNNFAIIFVSTIVLSLACLLVALICFRKAAVIASSIKEEASEKYTVEVNKAVADEDPEIAFNNFWGIYNPEKANIIANGEFWFFIGGGSALCSVILYGKGFTEAISVIMISFFIMVFIILIIKTYTIIYKIKDISISKFRYQKSYPRWAALLDNAFNLTVGHALFFVLFTFVKSFS